jgi:hypothetical protein
MNDYLFQFARWPALRLIIHHSSFIVRSILCAAIVIAVLSPAAALACPFCLAAEPTLAQRRESAEGVAVGEAARARDGAESQTFELHTIFKGPTGLKKRKSVEAQTPPMKTGSLAILFGAGDDAARVDRWDWSTAFANEALLAYFAAAPDLRQPPDKRLAYFVRYLEHADRDIARDAYLEFAHAPYEDVVAVADRFNFDEVRRWLDNPQVPDERKGFYGLVLGMAKHERDRAANQKALHDWIARDVNDFRSGFDGILAGYLLLTGEQGVALIEKQYFVDNKARHGDVRHATSALRFYYEYGPKQLRDRIARATARLLKRPEFAAAAIIDLARWEHWQVLAEVAALYERSEYGDGPTRRAIVGYLKACPDAEAEAALVRLKRHDPRGVEAAEKSLLLPTGK